MTAENGIHYEMIYGGFQFTYRGLVELERWQRNMIEAAFYYGRLGDLFTFPVPVESAPVIEPEPEEPENEPTEIDEGWEARFGDRQHEERRDRERWTGPAGLVYCRGCGPVREF